MALLPKPPVRRRRDGTYEVNVSEREREAIAHFLGQLREMLLSDDPLLRRLYPVAYVDDPEREEEFRELMKGELIERHFAAIETMEQTLGERTLDQEQLERWMHAVNSLRLVIGTRLDVSEETQVADLDEDDPDTVLYHFYEYLGMLLSFIVDALEASLPPPTE